MDWKTKLFHSFIQIKQYKHDKDEGAITFVQKSATTARVCAASNICLFSNQFGRKTLTSNFLMKF